MEINKFIETAYITEYFEINFIDHLRNFLIMYHYNSSSYGCFRLNRERCNEYDFEIKSKYECNIDDHENENGEIIVPDASNFCKALKVYNIKNLFCIYCNDLIFTKNPKVFLTRIINPDSIYYLQHSDPVYQIDDDFNCGYNGSFILFSTPPLSFILLAHGTVDLMQLAAKKHFLNMACPSSMDWENFSYEIDYYFK